MVNRIISIVKLLEVPQKGLFIKDIPMTKVRCQMPQRRNRGTTLVELVFWGKIVNDIIDYYKPNDYILIEGYLGLLPKKQTSKRVEITVLKIYPIKNNHLLDKT